MRYPVLAVVCLLMIVKPSPSMAVGKVTVDPNTLSAKSAQPVDSEGNDARLSQKVTYQVKQGRLHDIASDLSRITSVTISSGKNGSDWRVRDIPVTISAKDIELGMLLSTIADISHVALTSSKIDNNPRTYRFMRTPKMENALANYEDAQYIIKRQRFDREWAAAASLASKPEQPGDDEKSMKFNNARAIGRLVSALGTNVRDSMKTGEQIVLQSESVSETVRSAILELAAIMRKRQESDYNFTGSYHQNSKATQQDMEQAEVILSTQESFNYIYPEICVNTPAHNERGDAVIDSLYVSIRDALEFVKLPDNNDVPPDPLGGSDIKTKYTPAEWNNPNQEYLKTKIKLKAPEKLDGSPTLADVILALSDASGYTIVCEDFNSQGISNRINTFPQDEMTLGDVLRIFRWDVDWLADADNKLVVAVSRSWVDQHKSLVPESLIRQMTSKLEKDGVDLDDATPLTTLTDGQYNVWISGSRDLASLTMANFNPMKPLWALYDSLSSDEKLMVKSEAGIFLSRFEPEQLTAVCNKCNTGLTKSLHDRTSREQQTLPTDPKVLSALKMRITSKENWVKYQLNANSGGGYCWSSRSSSDTKPPQEGMLRKTTYVMEIFGDADGKTYKISNDGPNGFPYFSLKWGTGEHGPQGTSVR
ncbi:MAG: hypothetical protein ABFD54_09740 [Armatimonadota bacterium]|nr:hypothetical protein [bacterium]